jgi:hypothetical protein
MIAAEVIIPYREDEQWEDLGLIVSWCNQTIGGRAPFKDTVDSRRYPWYMEHGARGYLFCFAHPTDATAFSLRWAQ